MSENTKQNDIVTEILDVAFAKDWDDFSPEEYKHQLAETQAEVKKLTPDEETKKMNKRMNLRVQATALYRKDPEHSKATKARYFQAFCYACDHLADTCNLQKVSNITPTHFRRVTEYWKSYKAPSTVYTELSGFRHYCKLAGCKHPMPQNKELKLTKREPQKYNRGWLLTEYQKAREIAELSAMAATDDSGIDETEPTTSIETSPIGESAEPAAADAISAEAQAAEEPEIEIVQIKKGSKYWRLNGRDWENGINISYRLADGRSRSTNIKAINYHYLADLSNPGYCLEPNLVAPYYNEVGDSNSEAIFGIGDVDSGTLGATSWNKLTAEQREAIALVALYGLPNNIPFNGDDSSYCRAYFAAGQVLVWEFVMGIRYSAWPYEYVDPDITWSTARPRIPGSRLADFFADGPFIDAYYELAEMLETHFTIPSFAGDSLDNAETVELQPDGTGWYTATVADSNGILEKFVFQDSTGEVSFSNDGDNLVIRTKTVPNDPVFSATKQVPDPDGNSYFLTYAPGKSDRQKMLTIRTGDETEAVTAYIRLSVPVGAISGTKQTDTGADIQGWEMCLMDGDTIVATTTTDSEGKFAFTDVVPGTYTIHEVIPDDSDYRCVENDKMIAVAAGEVTTVMIENELNVGGLEIIKATDIGDHLAGWEFELYDASKNLIGTYTTPEDGRITISDLPVGVYYVKEKDSGNPYWVCDTSEKEVRVVAGQTSIVTITNCMKSAEIIGCKVDPLGQPLAGAVFLLEWSADGASWLPVNSTDLSYVTEGACTSEGLLDGCLTSGDDGIVRFSGLHPERYYQLTEVSAPNGYQLLVGAAFEGTIPADENLTVALTIVNAPEYVLPMTGSKSFIVMAVSLCICIAGCVGALVYLRRKEQ